MFRSGSLFDKTGGKERPSVSKRLREAIRSEHRLRYWPAVAVLGVLGFAALFVPRLRPAGALLSEPRTSRPEFTVLAGEDVSLGSIERRNVLVLVSPLADDSTLRNIFDWVLYESLLEFNQRQRKHLQVVWVYALDDSLASLGEWRAMAVWVDPRLPEGKRPSTTRLGEDAITSGSIQYDFTNPSRRRE